MNAPNQQGTHWLPQLDVPFVDTENEGASLSTPAADAPLSNMFTNSPSSVPDEGSTVDGMLSIEADKIIENPRESEELVSAGKDPTPPRRSSRRTKAPSAKFSMDGSSSGHGDSDVPTEEDSDELRGQSTSGASKALKKSDMSSGNSPTVGKGTPRGKRGGVNAQFRGARRAVPCFSCLRSAMSGQSHGECYEQTKDLGDRCERCLGHSCNKM